MTDRSGEWERIDELGPVVFTHKLGCTCEVCDEYKRLIEERHDAALKRRRSP